MLFRTFVTRTNTRVERFSIDVQSSTGYSSIDEVGTPPLSGDQIDYRPPSRSKENKSRYRNEFGKERFVSWIKSIEWPFKKSGEEEIEQSGR
jgi:hypothetical protein